MIWSTHGGTDQIPKQIWVFIDDGDRGGGNRRSHGSPSLSEDIPDHGSRAVGQSGSGALGRSLLVGPGGGSTDGGLLPDGSGLGGGGGRGERRGIVLVVVEQFVSARSETQIEVEVGIHGNGIEIVYYSGSKETRSDCVPERREFSQGHFDTPIR
ncbi:hypothetical protein ACFX13_006515 [Malus domestica]